MIKPQQRMRKSRVADFFRTEWPVWLGVISAVIFLFYGKILLSDLTNLLLTSVLFAWLFCMILFLAFNVVRHADCLAIKLGEPYGTLILTLAVISIEAVMIAMVMVTGKANPALARDTMFSVIMIVLNGLLGLTLLVGGLKHNEQDYNFRGARTYLGVLTPLAVLTLILPRFLSGPGGITTNTMELFLLLASGGLYLIFLWLQTGIHSVFYTQPPSEQQLIDDHHDHEGLVIRSVGYHAVLLVMSILPIVFLSKSLAKVIDFGMVYLKAPTALGGLLVAILVLSPEGLSALKAALSNKLQRTLNIALGSALSTIGLTVPVVLALGLFLNLEVELGLRPPEIVLLGLTLLLSTIILGGVRTTIIQGAVHLIVFVAYIFVIFD